MGNILKVAEPLRIGFPTDEPTASNEFETCFKTIPVVRTVATPQRDWAVQSIYIAV